MNALLERLGRFASRHRWWVVGVWLLAAVMVVVFTSFVLDPDPTIKMLAVGMAVAVLIDASVVRMVLVPALMSILGAHAWWLPGWLDRVIPDLQLEGELEPVPETPEPASAGGATAGRASRP